MIKKKKLGFILGLAAVAVACSAGATIVTASADTMPQVRDYESFKMINGASVRLGKDEKAIRFATRISKADLHSAVGITAEDTQEQINEKLATAKIATMITPTRYLDAKGLTDFVATTDLVDGDNDMQIVEIKATDYVKNTENIYDSDSSINKDDYYYFNACLYNVAESNISRQFSAKSYLQVGKTIVDYTPFDKTNNSRDIWHVANAAKNSGLYVDTENSDEPYDYLAALSSEYTVTVDGEGYTLKRGESVRWHDEEILKEVEGQKYFAYYKNEDGTAYKPAPVSEDLTLTSVYDEISYEYTNGSFTVTGATDMIANDRNTKRLLVVPDTYSDGENTANVTAIAAEAFSRNTDAKNGLLKKAILSDNVTAIGKHAFLNCTELTYIKLRGVCELETGVQPFMNCRSLKTVIVGRRFIVTQAFFINESITEETIDNFMKADIYYDSTYNNGDSYINIRGVYNTDHWTDGSRNNLFSNKIYTYSETKVIGGWYYDENGEIALWDGHYYTANNAGELNAQIPPAHSYKNHTCTVCGVSSINYTYDSEKKGYVLDSYAEETAELIIPEKYDDGINGEYAVVAIAAGTFKRNTTVRKVILPRTVTKIGESAFEGCTALTYVQMEGVNLMSGTNAFNNCTALRTLIVGRRFALVDRNFWSNNTTAGSLDLYVSDYNNGDAHINLQPCFEGSEYSAGHTRNDLFSLKVYKYSSNTSTAGGWTYVDGVATANDENSYYQITGANKFIDPVAIGSGE